MTPRQACRFSFRQRIAFDTVCALARATGVWRFPARLSGDLEEMGFVDKAYWLHKSDCPVRRAVRGSELEAFFAHQAPPVMPPGFAVERAIDIVAAGDLMPHEDLARSKALYDGIGHVLDADLKMANLECVVVDRSETLAIDTTTGPKVGLDEAALEVLVAPFDVLATANNHSLDFDACGVDATLAALEARDIACHGTNAVEDDAARSQIVDVGGIRIAIIAWTFGTNARQAPRGRPKIVNHTKLNHGSRADLQGIFAQLAHASAKGADFTIAHLHWGMEFEYYPRPEQLALAHALAEGGVDAIVGHHPHVAQPAEYYRPRRDPARVVPIFYSLGNLTNPFSSPYLARSALARLRVVRGTTQAGEARTYVGEARLVEVEQRSSMRGLELVAADAAG